MLRKLLSWSVLCTVSMLSLSQCDRSPPEPVATASAKAPVKRCTVPTPEKAPPAVPPRSGALQHTARESGRSQVAYIESRGPALVVRPGEPAATIRFGEGSARLAPSDRQTLSRVAALAQELGGRVRIVGHAGRANGGEGAKGEVAEFGLSLDRANAVAQELMRNGLTSDRLQVDAMGDAEPLVIAGTAAAEAPNRRAEVFVE